MIVTVIGNGFVGAATLILESSLIECRVYDIDPSKCRPPGTTLLDIAGCDIVMICVPTPMLEDGSCYTRIVESVLRDLRQLGNPHIVIRSTVPIGFSAKHKVHFMPEFLTEANFLEDFRTTPVWILGDDNETNCFRASMQALFTAAKQEGKIVSDTCRFVTTQEAEAIKYFRNCFLATKVSFCNEFEQFCRAKGISYDAVVDLAAADARIGKSHTQVPGPDGRRGYGGTCFPKDMASLNYQFAQAGVPGLILATAEERNTTIDRVEKDWQTNVGRAVI
jgi:UDPglucose 6-dehydrogenase